MNTIAKRAIAITAAAAVALGAGFGGWSLYQNRGSSAVNVYDSNELLNSYWQEDTQTDGVVSTEQFQAEYLSDTQTVREVQVKEGQKVKKGDILFTYDSTLTEIDLQRKDIEVQQKQLELNDARKELNKLRRYKPGKPIPGSTHSYTIPGDPDYVVPIYEGLELISGDGSRELPYSYLWKDTFLLNQPLLEAAMQGKVDCYVRFYLGGRDVVFPDPLPDPDPDPDPDQKPDPDPEDTDEKDKPSNEKEKKPGQGETPETPEKPSQGDRTDTGDGSQQVEAPSGTETDPGVSGEQNDQSGSGSGSGEEQGEQSGDAVPLSAREQAISPMEFFLLSAAAEDVGDPLPINTDTPSPEEPTNTDTPEPVDPEEDPYSASWVYHCQRTVNGCRWVPVSMSVGGVERQVMEPMLPMEDKENPEKQKKNKARKVRDPGIVYTKAQLGAMRQEQETIVRDCELELKKLAVEKKKLDRELNHSAVYSALDGVVLELHNPKKLEDDQPVLKVSGGGGYLIRGSVSELALDSVQPGQAVTVSDWSSGETYEGTVKSVSDYPTSGGGWTDGNSNVSYYSFSVSVDGSANLEQNSYVQMSYAPNGGDTGNSAYLLNSFIRSEGNKNYILYEQDGVLVKQYVRTGKSIWGMYTEILGGLEPDLYLAFPYGKNVREGAPTQHESVDVLYGYGI